jgi:TonB family protein
MKRHFSLFAAAFFSLILCAVSLSAQDNEKNTAIDDTVVLNSKAVKLPAPVYPSAAKAVGASGTVKVKVSVDENGSVFSATALSGHPLLRKAAENAAREARFASAFTEGKPVKMTGILIYSFVSVTDKSVDQVVGEQENDDIKEEVVNRKAIKVEQPEYPPAAKAVNASGAVKVRVAIDENGNVISSAAVSGHPLLRTSAEKAAKETRFAPTILSGRRVKTTGILVFNFVTLKRETK